MIDLTLSRGFKKRLYDFFIIAIVFGIAYYVVSCMYDMFKSKIVEGNTNQDYTMVLNEEWDTNDHGTSFSHGQAIGNWVLDCSGEFYDYGENNNIHIVKYNGTNKGLAMNTYMDSSGGEEIVAQTSVTVDKDKIYEVDADIFIETDHKTVSTDLLKYQIRLFDEDNLSLKSSHNRRVDSQVEHNAKRVNLTSTDNILDEDKVPLDAFYTINGTHYANSTKLYIELVCKTTSIATDENRVIWGRIRLRTKKCPSSKCTFNPCKGRQIPGGLNSSTGKPWTGNNYESSLDLPSIAVDGTSYFYKLIPQTCDPDVANCAYDTECRSCESGKEYIDPISLDIVGYSAPDDTGGTIIKKDGCSDRDIEQLDQSIFNDATASGNSVIGNVGKGISNLFTGGYTSSKGLLQVAGGSVQALGGGLYSLFDNESGEAVIVDGLANNIEGGENIVKGLVEAGRLPVNAVFNVDLKKIGNKNISEVIEESSKDAEGQKALNTGAGENGGYVPYEASIIF